MQSSLEIIYIAHKLPYPPHKGFQVKPYHTMLGLVRNGHKVHLVCPAAASQQEIDTARQELGKFCTSVNIVPLSSLESRIKAAAALANPFGGSLSVAYFSSRAITKTIQSILTSRKIDAFMLYSSTSAQYVPREYVGRSFIDMGDVDSAKWTELASKTSFPMSMVYAIEGKRLLKYEHWIVENFGGTNLATQAEGELLTDLSSHAKSTRLVASPNGVDTTKFIGGNFEVEDWPKIPETERKNFPQAKDGKQPVPIVFTGAMDYEPNVEAVEYFTNNVLPLIKQRVPEACFLIVGGNPVPRVLKLHNAKDVFVTGFVREAPPYLRYARVVVVPLRLARGIQNKALEAMACERPLVCTALAAKGVNGTHLENMLVADSPEELADAVVQLIENQELADRLAKNARRFILENYEWQPITNFLVRKLEELACKSA